MKKLISLITMALLVISIVPMVIGVDVGTSITPDIETEDFEPLIWMCDDRVVVDDMVEQGRIIDRCGEVKDKDGNLKGYELCERTNNYAFTGEKIEYNILVMDKNGINKIADVFMTVGDEQGTGNDIEVNCVELQRVNPASCNARIDEEVLTNFNPQLMRFYECTFTVEPEMEGEYWITAEVEDLDGLSNTVDENEYWFLNPVIALSVDGDLTFEDVRPGTMSYSETLLVGNDAEEGSGVLLDMFISGTDFYDSSNSGAQCPTTNQLSLSNFNYYATNGAYSTQDDGRSDSEGYVGINYGDSFSTSLYNAAEIIQGPPMPGGYYRGNILSPGAEMALTFRLNLPEPCNGDFDTGSIFFWGEAI